MILVKDIAKELSIKIGDPRNDGGDGSIFFSEDRLRYISRSYGKLIRILSMAMRKYKPSFVLPLEPFDKKYDSDQGTEKFANPVVFDKPFIEIEEVVVRINDKTTRVLASKLDPKNYTQTKYGLDTTNKPDFEKKNIFYSVINNKLYLLPGSGMYLEVNAMGVADLPSEIIPETELPIDKVYADLLITLAAIEAMNDLPHPQKVQLYRQELLDQISVITAYTNLMERREGEKGNG